MKEFIKIQYLLYQQGQKSISVEKIKALANIYMTEEEQNKLFG